MQIATYAELVPLWLYRFECFEPYLFIAQVQGARIFRQPAGFAAVAHLVVNRVMTPKWDGCRPPEKDKDVWFLDVLSVFGRKLSNFMPESCRRLLRGARSCCLPYRPEKSDVLFGPLGLLFTISWNVDKTQLKTHISTWDTSGHPVCLLKIGTEMLAWSKLMCLPAVRLPSFVSTGHGDASELM